MAQAHTWKFFRTGGLDQVTLETGADLLDLENLDQKLWVALSCPVSGIEIDEKTLVMIDADGDGRIRVPELLAAIKWAAARLGDPGILLEGGDALALDAINTTTPEGQVILTSARQILTNLAKPGSTVISAEDSGNTAKIFAASPLNGDGIIPPEATDDPAAQMLIKDIIASLGGSKDRTGSDGVTSEQVDKFFAELNAYAQWAERGGEKNIAVLGDATGAAVEAVLAVRAKVDDYFGRCRLAAYDGRAIAALNRSEADYLALAAKDMKITADEVSGFPLSHIEAGRALPLFDGVNPAWAGALATLHASAVTPVFGAGKRSLVEADWVDLNSRFAAYEAWLGEKEGAVVEKLGLARVKEILNGRGYEILVALVARDRSLEPEFKAISDVDRLVHYHRDMRALLRNFVNFADFYSHDKWAVFQAGVLYLDSRSTELCIRTEGHNPLAAMSKVYIAYCACTRSGETAMNIAACFTQGDSDYLFVGRRGVFYDRRGRDWDAVITTVVDNPISLRQAFWSPYKKFVRMIEEQVAKRAAAADSAAGGKLATSAEQAANADKLPSPPKKIDVGTVAALGVAVGAIGGALGAVATGLAKLAVWQLPFVVVAVIMVISLPAVIIAWLKLRQRTLGPILEASGWAINGRVKINAPLGKALTNLAIFPPGAQRSLVDPYEDRDAARRKRQTILLLILLLVAAAAVWIRFDAINHPALDGQPRYFWEERPAPTKPTPAPMAAPSPAPAK
jgi:hypothetical protein